MTDKNGIEIKEGNRILSKGKFQYSIKRIDKHTVWESETKSHEQDFNELLASGINLHHSDLLKNLDLTQVEVIKE